MTWKRTPSRTIRLALAAGAIIVPLAVGLWLWKWAAAPCRPVDRWLGRSGCIDLYRVPRFVSAPSGRPGLVFTPDGRRLVMAGIELQSPAAEGPQPQRYAIVELDAASGAVLRRTGNGDYHPHIVGTFGVSWTGRYAAGVSFESSAVDRKPDSGRALGRVRVWRLDGEAGGWESPQVELSLQPDVQFSSDDALVLVGDSTWQVASGRRLETAQSASWWAGWGPDKVAAPGGRVMARWDFQAASIDLIDPATKQRVRRLAIGVDPAQAIVGWLHFSHQGDRLAVLVRLRGPGAVLQVWDVRTGARVIDAEAPALDTPTAWSPDDRRLAVASGIASREEGQGIAIFQVP